MKLQKKAQTTHDRKNRDGKIDPFKNSKSRQNLRHTTMVPNKETYFTPIITIRPIQQENTQILEIFWETHSHPRVVYQGGDEGGICGRVLQKGLPLSARTFHRYNKREE